MKDKKPFMADFYDLAEIWCRDSNYDNVGDYEKGLIKVGSYMQCTILDLVECFPDFSMNKSKDVREVVSLTGIVAQLIDDRVDDDKGVSTAELDDLLGIYKNKLYDVADVIGQGRNVWFIQEAYPFLMKTADSNGYKKLRNHLATVSQ